jgi:hypothetical protein
VVLNFAICTAQLSTGGASFALNAEISSLRLRAKTVSLGLVSPAQTVRHVDFALRPCKHILQFVSYFLAWLTAFVTPYIFQSPGYLGAKTARESAQV